MNVCNYFLPFFFFFINNVATILVSSQLKWSMIHFCDTTWICSLSLSLSLMQFIMLILPYLNDQLVLELQGDGKGATLDDPSVDIGCLDGDLIEKVLLIQI